MAFQNDSIFWVEVEKITPNPYQPRREFDEDRLTELAESIRMYGVLQPLTVTRREIQRDNGAFHTEYELIAGERRLRASKKAGIGLVPVIIREGEQDEQEKLELAIIENLQREDLNAVDRALAFRQLADTFKLSHAQVAKKVGRSREYVSNSVRLLALPEHILQALRIGDIAEGHARTLLMMSEQPEEQDTVFREILLKKLSVREVERIARSVASDKVRRKDKYYDPEITALEKQFTETLGTRVQIQKTEYGGKLTIDYFSPDDLAYMLERMNDERNAATINGRRPFSPPTQAAGGTEVASGTEEAEVESSAPLSALIAQLQQVEETFSPAAPKQVPAALSNAPVSAGTVGDGQDPHSASSDVSLTQDEVILAADATDEKQDDSYSRMLYGDERNSEETVTLPRITLTDAPVSPVRPQYHTAAGVVPISRPPATEQVAGPRIVCINRACTTAVYVADSVFSEEPVTQVVDKNTVSQNNFEQTHNKPDSNIDQELYSIRNFNL